MAGEYGGMDQGEPSGDYREFRRMMDAAGSEGRRRMIERLTEQVRVNPHDADFATPFLCKMASDGMDGIPDICTASEPVGNIVPLSLCERGRHLRSLV